jgi:hypothetical protein
MKDALTGECSCSTPCAICVLGSAELGDVRGGATRDGTPLPVRGCNPRDCAVGPRLCDYRDFRERDASGTFVPQGGLTQRSYAAFVEPEQDCPKCGRRELRQEQHGEELGKRGIAAWV